MFYCFWMFVNKLLTYSRAHTSKIICVEAIISVEAIIYLLLYNDCTCMILPLMLVDKIAWSFHIYCLHFAKDGFSVNLLSVNPTKWSNTFNKFVGKLLTNCLSVFDHITGLVLKELRISSVNVTRSAGNYMLTCLLFLLFYQIYQEITGKKRGTKKYKRQ